MIRPFSGTSPKIADNVFVAETAAVIGNVEIGEGSSIWYGVTIRGDVNEVRIGKNTNIQDGTVIHVDAHGEHWNGMPTHIGDNVTVGHLAMLHACTLEDGSFVGMSATVLDGAVVETGAMVAAGAVVTPGKRVLAGQLWAGMPAKHMRDLSEEDIAYFQVSADHYSELAGKYLAEES
ncbi:MAG: gamma carbonic anhydrase family protein [Alphaproteobacteria bacterium]|jgi:carbonic anhydrase/acetyltransferase-like protein (isoleucine patch superfamily)